MKERLRAIMTNGKATPILVGVVAIGIGGVIFYKRRKNKYTVYFESEGEIAHEIETSDDSMIFEEIQQAEEEHVAEPVNVFVQEDDDWSYEDELSSRSGSEPYILHVDEFIGDEMGFKQETVTYYEADDIMADVNDVPMYNWISITGPLKWGHGSNDKNVVYVRNEKLKKEFEILRHHGSFEVEVTGLHLRDTELRHSILKFRDD